MNPDYEKRIKALEDTIQSMKNQQIKYPLDKNSRDILTERIPVFVSKGESTITATKSIKVVIDGQPYQINVL